MSVTEQTRPTTGGGKVDVDAVIIGAGFGGMRFLHETRSLGLTAKVFEAGTDVGGTWYWNRYPGARTDTEAWGYGFPFAKEVNEAWTWSQRFPQQPEVHAYLCAVADHYDMRRDIQFRTRVQSAHLDEERNVWTVTTDAGDVVTCTFVLAASGLLSRAIKPPMPGIETFEGEHYLTSRWPKEEVSFEGKRIALVGAGATAVQVLPVIAHRAEHVTMFQRTPNYVMPSRNRMLDDHERADHRSRHDALWEIGDAQTFGFPFEDTWRLSSEVADDDEFRRVLDAGWEAGGFRYLFETFQDVLVDSSVNERCSEYVREKIRALVKDRDTAELLCPRYAIGGKRPPLGHFYYETFNRDNVSLVSVIDNPIVEITPKGLRLQDGTEHAVDMIIFALGFDAVTGALTSMDVRGRDGITIAEAWADGAQATYGVSCEGFPNLFTMFGPGSPAGNVPPAQHRQTEFVGRLIRYALDHGHECIETTREAQEAYGALCREIFEATLLSTGSVEGRAWWSGSNIDGKATSPMFHFGGVPAYLTEIAKEVEGGYPSFRMTAAPVPTA